MNIEELKRRLEEENISRDLYSFFNDGNGDCFVISKEGYNWIVYCTERGERFRIKKFQSEDEACLFFLNEILCMPSARYKLFTEIDFEKFPIWIGNDQKGYHPSLQMKILEHDDNLIIHANFKSSQYKFDGYLIGRENFDACVLFVRNKMIKINTKHPFNIYNTENINNLFKILGCEKFDFFPLKYESSVYKMNGQIIKGELDVQQRF